MMKSPSEKQIKFADTIAEELGLDFPKGSDDFTAQRYYYFISQNIKEFKELHEKDCIPIMIEGVFQDDEDIFWGWEYGLWEF